MVVWLEMWWFWTINFYLSLTSTLPSRDNYASLSSLSCLCRASWVPDVTQMQIITVCLSIFTQYTVGYTANNHSMHCPQVDRSPQQLVSHSNSRAFFTCIFFIITNSAISKELSQFGSTECQVADKNLSVCYWSHTGCWALRDKGFYSDP